VCTLGCSSAYSSLNDEEFESILKGEKELEELCPSEELTSVETKKE